jgi:Carboxypeptidase regulatory-like domain
MLVRREATGNSNRRISPFLKAIALLSLVFACTPHCLLGQATASLRIAVTDSKGAVVPGASVKASQDGTGRVFEQTTNAEGNAVLTPIPEGNYQVEVSSAGFAAVVTKGLQVDVGQDRLLNIVLKIANVNQTVEISAAAITLETEDAAQATVMPSEMIEDMPLNQRQFSALTLLAPGATNPTGQVSGAATSQDVIVNGLRIRANDFLLDGADNNAPSQIGGLSSNVINPPPDALTEFRFETSNFDAEYGTAIGAVLNVSIKSGTNQFHGDAWEFNRNTVFTAPTWADNEFNVPKTPLNYNLVGGTLGGPVIKDKLFAFGDFQYFGSNSSSTSITTVPLPANIAGDFSNLTYTLIDPYTGLPFPTVNGKINQIPAGEMNTLGQKILSEYPSPNTPGSFNSSGQPANNYKSSDAIRVTTKQADLRLDYQLSRKDSFFLRYSYSDNWTFDQAVLPLSSAAGVYPNGDNNDQLENRQQTFGWTRVLSSSMVNDLRLVHSAQQENNHNSNDGSSSSSSFGFQGVLPGLDSNLPLITLSPFQAFGIYSYYYFPDYDSLGPGLWNPQYHHPWGYTLADDFSLIKGNHVIKFGPNYKIKQDNYVDIELRTEGMNYSGQYTADPATGAPGEPVADLLLGLPASIGAQNNYVAHQRQQIWGGYGQDQWRVTPKLTLQVGLRYDYYTPYYGVEGHGNVRFDFPSNTLLMAPGGLPVSSAASLGAKLASNKYAMKPDYNDWSPRVGFALQAANRFAIHGNFGLFFDSQDIHGTTPNVMLNPPNTYQTVQNETFPLSNGWTPPMIASGPFPPNFLNLATIPTSELSLEVFPASFPAQKVIQYNFSLQYQVSKDSTYEMAYVGNLGSKLDAVFEGNNAPWGVNGGIQANVNYPNWGPMDMLTKDGNSHYNALQTKFEKRGSTWMDITSLTWASGMDNTESTTVPGGNPVQIVNVTAAGPVPDLGKEWAFASDFTRLHFTSSTAWNLPFGRGQRFGSRASGVLDGLINGWQFSYILTAQSGLPVNVTLSGTGSDPTNTTGTGFYSFYNNQGGGTIRPNRVPNSHTNSGISPRKNPNAFLNANAYSLQPLNTPGDAARNSAWGPTYIDLDSAVQKSISLNERYKMLFRFEAFNALNHTNFSQPNGTWGGGAFGAITSANPNRQVQMAAKFVF